MAGTGYSVEGKEDSRLCCGHSNEIEDENLFGYLVRSWFALFVMG